MNTVSKERKTQAKYTYCSICEQACGLKVTVSEDEILDIEPDKGNPYTWKDFCIKAKMADDVRSHPVRIRTPLKRDGSKYVKASYEEAIEEIGKKLKRLIDAQGPDSVGVYSGNPAGFGFANSTFQSAFFDAIGSRQRFWVGSVDQNALHLVANRMYGSNWASLQPDIDLCKCFLFIGTNPAISGMNWVGKVPDGWRRVLKAVDQGAELMIVDPRLSESAQKATLHIAVRPEQDWALLLGMVQTIFDHGWDKPEACEQANGVRELRRIAGLADLDYLSRVCGVEAETIRDVAQRFAHASTAMCVARTGPAIGRHGAITEWLSHVLNLITGRTDRPGGRFLPGSLVDLFTLDEGPNFPNTQPSRVKGRPPVAGFYSLAELPDEITVPGEGQIRALFINGGNPVASGAQGQQLDEALASLELLVAIDLMQRESHRHAHWIIPGVHFLEREELHVSAAGVSDEPFVQASAQCVEPPVGVRHEWEFFRDLAEEIGRPLFGGALEPDPKLIAQGVLARKGILTYDEIVSHPHGLIYGEKSYGHLKAALAKRGRTIEACPREFKEELERLLHDESANRGDPQFPYQLISRRRLQMMNSWLTETSGAKISGEVGDQVEMNAEDAANCNLTDGDRVSVRSAAGELEATVVVSEKIRSGVVIMEHGWGARLFDPISGEEFQEARGVARNLLVSRDDLDPLTGVPRLNGTPVDIRAKAYSKAVFCLRK